MEKFKIVNGGDMLRAWLHPIEESKLVIHVQDEVSMTVNRGNGDEEDYQYGDAAIMLNKDNVGKLIAALNDFWAKMPE